MRGRTSLNIWIAALVFLLGIVGTSFAGQIIYVDADATGNNDGSSWADAYNYLQDGLADANSIGGPAEIRVAEGTYKPDEDTLHPDGTGNREATFQLINNVAIKGSYAGFGEPDPNARDVNTYETILSGNIGSWGSSDNSYHVVTGSGTDETSVLDGFTVTGGNADGPSHSDCWGGGMYNEDSSPMLTNCTFSGSSATFGGGMCNRDNSNPTITNCTFSGNSATFGGGMCNYRYGSSPTLTKCTFSGNSASQGGGMDNINSNSTLTNCTFIGDTADEGGGMYNIANSNPTLTNCTFIGNTAERGGGMCNEHNSSPTLTNCVFSGNSANPDGGGMYNYNGSSPMVINCTFGGNSADFGAGVYNCWHSSPNLTNCTFISNSAYWLGGGMYNGYSSTTLTNCTFGENSAGYGGGMYNYCNSNLTLTNCILWGDTATNGPEIALTSTAYPSELTVSYSDVQGGLAGVYVDEGCTLNWGLGNIDVEPLFVDSAIGDYHLLADSPCIDVGDPCSDFGLEPEPDGGRVNMGAYGNTLEATCKYGLVLESYNLVSKSRVERTVFDYVYTMTLNNNSTAAVSNVVVELLDASDNVSIFDPDVTFAYIGAGESATSEDTFTLRVDRAVPIDAAIISWRATIDWEGGEPSAEEIFTTKIILESKTGDLNGDGRVDLKDFAELGRYWLQDEPSVDIQDMAILAEHWLEGTETN